jgi:hypothetical protein
MTDAVTFLHETLAPSLTFCEGLPGWSIPSDERATLWMLATAGQETEWQNIAQAGSGNFDRGMGPWQMQRNTCSDILNNSASRAMAILLCTQLYINPIASTVYTHLLKDTRLSAGFSRLDLRCDPHALPVSGDEEAGWETYLFVQRPGAPSRSRWAVVYPQALAAMKAVQVTV